VNALRSAAKHVAGIAVPAAIILASPGAVAQNTEAAAHALKAKYAGNPDSDALLREPAVREQLKKLLGARLPQLERNLDVRGQIDLVGGALSVSGNASHKGGEEEAVVCVWPFGPKVQAAIYSKGRITAFAADPNYDALFLCIKDWITQVNSGHRDRLQKPKNVQVVRAL
jgi:hypothetical protein